MTTAEIRAKLIAGTWAGQEAVDALIAAARLDALNDCVALATKEARNEPSKTAGRMAYRIARYIREDLVTKVPS